MLVVYLVAHLLKDLALEVFTPPALGKSPDTQHKSLPLAASNPHRHYCVEPFRPLSPRVPVLTSTLRQGSGAVCTSHYNDYITV